jgi:hypothetical protein
MSTATKIVTELPVKILKEIAEKEGTEKSKPRLQAFPYQNC